MTSPPPGSATRKPRVFKPDDPSLGESVPPAGEAAAETSGSEPASRAAPPPFAWPDGLDVERGIRWGSVLVAALAAATTFALSLWFYRLISVGLWGDDWVGWTMRGLIAVALFALAMILLRELVGLIRLGRLASLKADLTKALAANDRKAERKAVQRLLTLYGRRPELAWANARLKDHLKDVHDPGALATLADRDVVAELDGAVRRAVTSAARRVATVTALSPMALVSVAFVAVENLRLLRKIATLYGGRPGLFGLLRLARSVLIHLVATGGVALTDDLLGQFIGQDVLRRLSARLGEGAFNGALTARVGVAAIDIIRPLPFLEARPVRVRDVLAEVLRRSPGAAAPPEAKP
jgi:putative membrane protein